MESFQRKHYSAYEKWSHAESLLWSSDSEKQLTTMGHLCREALQELITNLVSEYSPPQVDGDKAHTVTRLRSVLATRKEKLGERESALLDALLVYCGTVIDLIQRQEHGAQKEGDSLVWTDGRRVVFQTAVVMIEIDSGLSRVK